MVSFRRVVAGTDINHWWDDGANAIAFSRGSKGFVVINHETAPLTATIATGVAPGNYCDLLTGGLGASGCVGTLVSVAADGSIQISLSANSALAIDLATKR